MKFIWISVHVLVVLGILLLGFSPFFWVMRAANIATANDCALDEGSVHPCVVDGVDMGKDLYTWGMMGWLGIFTLPLSGVIALVYLLVVLAVFLIRRELRKRKAQAGG